MEDVMREFKEIIQDLQEENENAVDLLEKEELMTDETPIAINLLRENFLKKYKLLNELMNLVLSLENKETDFDLYYDTLNNLSVFTLKAQDLFHVIKNYCIANSHFFREEGKNKLFLDIHNNLNELIQDSEEDFFVYLLALKMDIYLKKNGIGVQKVSNEEAEELNKNWQEALEKCYRGALKLKENISEQKTYELYIALLAELEHPQALLNYAEIKRNGTSVSLPQPIKTYKESYEKAQALGCSAEDNPFQESYDDANHTRDHFQYSQPSARKIVTQAITQARIAVSNYQNNAKASFVGGKMLAESQAHHAAKELGNDVKGSLNASLK